MIRRKRETLRHERAVVLQQQAAQCAPDTVEFNKRRAAELARKARERGND